MSPWAIPKQVVGRSAKGVMAAAPRALPHWHLSSGIRMPFDKIWIPLVELFHSSLCGNPVILLQIIYK
eukprot:3181053-Ditylum_brightwellii.AAC.1